MDHNGINFFEDNFIQDVLVQGLLLSTFLIIGLSLIFRETFYYYREFGYTKELRELVVGIGTVIYGFDRLIVLLRNRSSNEKKSKKKNKQKKLESELQNGNGGKVSDSSTNNLKVESQNDNEGKVRDSNGNNLKAEKKTSNYLGHVIYFLFTLCLCYVILVTSGVIGNRLGDTAIDSDNIYHLGLKNLWFEKSDLDAIVNQSDDYESRKHKVPCPHDTLRPSKNKSTNLSYAKPGFENMKNMDRALKISTFNEVFPEIRDGLCIKSKLEIYFKIKHKLLNVATWRNYLQSTQRVINYSQVLLLSFLILLFLLLFDFWLAIRISYRRIAKNRKYQKGQWATTWLFPILLASFIVYTYENPDSEYLFWGVIVIPFLYGLFFYVLYLLSPKGKRDITTIVNYRIIAIWVCILCYVAVGITWRENEKEFDYKVYDVFRTHEVGIYNELKLLRKQPDADIWNDKPLQRE